MKNVRKHRIGLVSLTLCLLYTVGFSGEDAKPIALSETINITVDASMELGPLPEIWQPGISIEGISHTYSPIGYASTNTLEMWDGEIGFERGLHHVPLMHHTFGQPGASLEDRGRYIADIKEKGGEVLVRLIGSPINMVNWAALPDNYWAYPPEDMAEWEEFIYDELKYLVVENVVINNLLLFNDEEEHWSLGLGDNIWFSCWYGIWGQDAFQFRGSEEEFFELWNATYRASKRLEEDYGLDIKLGGFGFGQSVDELWDYGGFVHNLLAYSNDPDSNGFDDDRIPIDWIDYQFRHTNPFAISKPTSWRRDIRGQIEAYLELFGYGSEIPIMANAWHGQKRVKGLSDSFGRSFTEGVETQCEIDAALNPTRLYDMELAGQRKQFREAIQDYAGDNDFPLFRHTGFGAIGITTLGLESEGFLGLKKAPWNTFKLIDSLGDIKLNSISEGEMFLDEHATVNAIATRNSEDNTVRVLVWTYINPLRYIQNSPPTNMVDYDELYSLITTEYDSDSFYVDLTVDNLNFDDMRITRYLVDKTHSNSFTYRNEICWAVGLEGGVEVFPYRRDYTMEDINKWTFDNNPYNASVDLEKVQDDTITNLSKYETVLALLPYSTCLIVIDPLDIISSDEEPDPSSSSIPSVPLIAYQNVPNPFNPSTRIAFTVLEYQEEMNNSPEESRRIPVSIKIYDIRGRLIRELLNEELFPGNYTVTWDGRDSQNQSPASGIYFYSISTEGFNSLKKMMLIK